MILQRIKTPNGSVIAFIIDHRNGVQSIQKLNGSVIGWYRPSPSGGKTTDQNGRLIGIGNVLVSLIADSL